MSKLLFIENMKSNILIIDLVDEKTGEEGELVTFSCRAKLYIWKENQWKERGLGMCKERGEFENSFNGIIVWVI